MQFDFSKNQFLNTESFSDKPFIIGSDIVYNQKETFDLYLKIKTIITDLNIPIGHPVCIYGEKEALFPIVMIALISLDIPYIPIDAIMPSGRIDNIKKQTQSKVLFNCSEKKCDVAFDVVITSHLKVSQIELIEDYPLIVNGQDPIRYILFTSGSTGSPKGVQITRSALNSFANWYLTWPLLSIDSVFMNQAPFSFDVSLCDFIGTFGLGGTMILNNYSILKSGQLFLERLKINQATTLVCTPSFILMYLTVPEFNEINFPSINQFVFMGEELPVNTVKKLKQKFATSKIVNAFGPTEATVVTTYIEITNDVLSSHLKSLPIGYCRPNSEIVILNKDEESGIGEIGLIGPHLSIGYFKDDEKTAQSFVFENEKRIYKTGDIGYIKNNLVYYLGRNDGQVKLNGYRIELEEITNVLLTHSIITNAVTIPLKAGEVTKKIVSFLIIKDIIPEDVSETLKSFLLKYLPSYMIPSEFIVVNEFPLNANFKTDKKALLEIYLNLN
jgi:D-alanine--poly(phosphoribitol) ligase subunit 1